MFLYILRTLVFLTWNIDHDEWIRVGEIKNHRTMIAQVVATVGAPKSVQSTENSVYNVVDVKTLMLNPAVWCRVICWVTCIVCLIVILFTEIWINAVCIDWCDCMMFTLVWQFFNFTSNSFYFCFCIKVKAFPLVLLSRICKRSSGIPLFLDGISLQGLKNMQMLHSI